MNQKSSSLAWIAGAAVAIAAVALMAAGLVLASSHGSIAGASARPEATTAMTSPPATVPSSPATVSAAGVATTSTSAAGGSPAGGRPTTTASGRHPAATSTTATTAAVATVPSQTAGPSPAAPGTYYYHQIGSLPGTPAVGTLVVAPAAASGTQTWTRVVGGTVAPATTVMLFNATGAYLVDPGASATPASCTFATPLPWPPWPTSLGRSATGQATCSAPITSYRVTVRVSGSATVALGGTMVDTAIVVSTIVIAGSYDGSPLGVTLTETDYDALTLRIPVETITHVTGHVLGLSVATSRTDTLESATPS